MKGLMRIHQSLQGSIRAEAEKRTIPELSDASAQVGGE